jgi:hypothetical protein
MKRRGVKGKKKMKRIRVRQKHVMEMLLNRKDGAHQNRAGDIKSGKSRKAKHKGKREW